MTQKHYTITDGLLGFIANYLPFIAYLPNNYAAKNMSSEDFHIYSVGAAGANAFGIYQIVRYLIDDSYLINNMHLSKSMAMICTASLAINSWSLYNAQSTNSDHNHQLELAGDYNMSVEVLE